MLSHSFSDVDTHTYTYIFTQVAVYWKVNVEDNKHTRTYIHAWSRVRKHTYISGRSCFSTFRSAFITYTNSRLLESWLMTTNTHPYSHLIAYTNTHFCFTLTGAFPLHTCSNTRNLRTHFTCMGRVFFVETAVLQTVLWDIRAWSTLFLVYSIIDILII